MFFLSVNSRELIRLQEADGWYLKSSEGSHHHFVHPTKSGKVTVPHPRKDMAITTIKSIERQAQLKLRRRS